MGIELEITKPQNVVAKTLSIHMKVCDQFQARLIDSLGKTICEQDEGYVPKFMPGEHYGDYVMLEIDLESGRITNWQKPSASDLQSWIEDLDERGR